MAPPRFGFSGSDVHQLMVSQAVAAIVLPDLASTGIMRWGLSN